MSLDCSLTIEVPSAVLAHSSLSVFLVCERAYREPDQPGDEYTFLTLYSTFCLPACVALSACGARPRRAPLGISGVGFWVALASAEGST